MSRPETPFVQSPQSEAVLKKKAASAEETQVKTFTNWVNAQLSKHGEGITRIDKDLRDGRNLIKLLEYVSEETVGKPEQRNMRVHQVQNVGMAIKFLEFKLEGQSLAVAPEHIVDGNLKMTLGLVWMTIYRFQINRAFYDSGEAAARRKKKQQPDAKATLLAWVQNELIGYKELIQPINDFHRSWQNGEAFLALIHSYRKKWVKPFKSELGKRQPKSWETSLTRAFKVAQEKMGIPQLLDPQDIIWAETPDERSIMTYVSEFYIYFTKHPKAQLSDEEEEEEDESEEDALIAAPYKEELDAHLMKINPVIGDLQTHVLRIHDKNIPSFADVKIALDAIPVSLALVEEGKALSTEMEQSVTNISQVADDLPRSVRLKLDYCTKRIDRFRELKTKTYNLDNIRKNLDDLYKVAKKLDDSEVNAKKIYEQVQQAPLLEKKLTIDEIKGMMNEIRSSTFVPTGLQISPSFLKEVNSKIVAYLPKIDAMLPSYERYLKFYEKIQAASADLAVVEQGFHMFDDFIPAAVEDTIVDILASLDTKQQPLQALYNEVPSDFDDLFAEKLNVNLQNEVKKLQQRWQDMNQASGNLRERVFRAQLFNNIENSCRMIVSKCEAELDKLRSRLSKMLSDLHGGLDNFDMASKINDLHSEHLMEFYADLAELEQNIEDDVTDPEDLEVAKEILKSPESVVEELSNSLSFETRFILACKAVNEKARLYDLCKENIKVLKDSTVTITDQETHDDVENTLNAVVKMLDQINLKRKDDVKNLPAILDLENTEVDDVYMEALNDRYMGLEQQSYVLSSELDEIRRMLDQPTEKEIEVRTTATLNRNTLELHLKTSMLMESLSDAVYTGTSGLASVKEAEQKQQALLEELKELRINAKAKNLDETEIDNTEKSVLELMEISKTKMEEFEQAEEVSNRLDELKTKYDKYVKLYKKQQTNSTQGIQSRLEAIDPGVLEDILDEIEELRPVLETNTYLKEKAFFLESEVMEESETVQHDYLELTEEINNMVVAEKKRPQRHSLPVVVSPRPSAKIATPKSPAPKSPSPTTRVRSPVATTRAKPVARPKPKPTHSGLQSPPPTSSRPPASHKAPAPKPVYVPDKKSRLDVEVANIVNTIDTDVALVKDDYKEGTYWVGGENGEKKQVYCRILNDKMVMVRIGGGWQDLKNYLHTNAHRHPGGVVNKPTKVIERTRVVMEEGPAPPQ